MPSVFAKDAVSTKAPSWRAFGGLPLFLLFLLPLSLLQSAALAREILPGPVAADVIHVIDGDTIEMRARIWLGTELTTKVRLKDVDTPEMRGRCARERDMARRAREFVVHWSANRRLELRDVTFGKYAGRVLARVYDAERGENLGQALIQAGLARAYGGGAKSDWCG